MFLLLFIIIIVLLVVVASLKKRALLSKENSDKDVIGLCTLIQYGSSVLIIVSIFFSSFTIVQPGEVKFLKLFGKMQYQTYDSGWYFLNPFGIVMSADIKRQALDYTNENTASGLTSDKVVLTIDVTVPFIQNAAATPMLRERYGNDLYLISSSSRSAIRDCTAKLNWEKAVSEEGRIEMTTCIPKKIGKIVSEDLMQAGFDKKMAEVAFTFPNAQVREMLPVNKTIIDSIAQEMAASVDLRRQETLTSIAVEEAKRRKNEGAGISLMMSELPDSYTVQEMTSIIIANANKTSADAFMKSVENGNPNINVVIGGGSDTAISLNKK